jgi:hypothetical protein
VDELGAKFDRNWYVGIVPRQDAPANAIARFEDVY